ncbi:HAD-IA family hydrolase [Desulfococcus sp.]|uniref:HAD-IA family hydrolase n=1 Tax=Desulfococcus sp. TaxID=2025834 RepID=UPI00359400E3
MKNRIVKAVLFDFDGTLTCPGALDFPRIKQAVGCPPEQPVLEYIEAIADPAAKARAHRILEDFEMAAAEVSTPCAGAEQLVQWCLRRGVRLGILTRNLRASVLRALENFSAVDATDFELIISREDPVAPKPHPEGVVTAAARFALDPREVAVVGDFVFDIQAGNGAGATTVWLDHGLSATLPGQRPFQDLSDHRAADMDEVRDVLRLYLPLSGGKFPNDLLKKYLDAFDFRDPSVIIHPGIGEDIAAVTVAGEEVLILKSDPITFATDAIGQYAVLVNANDIATSGAVPRWLLTTLMFPLGTTPAQVFEVLNDLEATCRNWRITLCGGHTEITDAVTRPVVTGMLAGTVAKKDLVDKARMRSGDVVLLTKAVAVEGTSIIAREFGEELKKRGMTEAELGVCRGFLSRISILKEARIAAASGGISAMHDVTEGGLSTALEELSIAGGHEIRVMVENIPVFPQTQKICDLLDIAPLGLIGSGSLLIACRETNCQSLIRQIHAAGIQVTVIGKVLDPGHGITAVREGRPADWPRFETDEIARVFDRFKG